MTAPCLPGGRPGGIKIRPGPAPGRLSQDTRGQKKKPSPFSSPAKPSACGEKRKSDGFLVQCLTVWLPRNLTLSCPLVGVPLVQDHSVHLSALGAFAPRSGIRTCRTVLCKADNTLIKHVVGYFLAAVWAFVLLLFHGCFPLFSLIFML
jgi:hypothetical protein